MKGIIIYMIGVVLIMSCKNVSKPIDTKKDSIASWLYIKPEHKKYAPYISYARYLIYLKMAAEPIATEAPPYALSERLYYGMYNLKLVGCQEKQSGLWLDFSFLNGDKQMLMLGKEAEKNNYTCSVCFWNKNLKDYYFAYGDLNIIFFDRPSKIDTAKLLKYYNSGKYLNEWFKKKLEDSILSKK